MRCFVLVLLVVAVVMVGCSSASNPAVPSETPVKESTCTPGSNDITWGHWLFYVSEDHTSIEAVPIRQAEWHFNITKMVEDEPCDNCLQIGQPQPQPDGTLKVPVSLRHPFPNQPRFTGFDVRGVVMFPATRYWYADGGSMPTTRYPSPFDPTIDPPMFFSWPGDEGGGAVLNPDGYSYYFWPGFEYWWPDDFEPTTDLDAPRYNYQQGEYATDAFPDSTINPYLEFNDGTARRMFKVTDIIHREYHLRFPDGEFVFGYVIQASWWPPDVIPVIHPEEDFPPEANAEDPYITEFTQYAPIDPYIPGSVQDNLFARLKFRLASDDLWIHGATPLMYAPDIQPNSDSDLGMFAADINLAPVAPRIWEGDMFCFLSDDYDIDPYIDGIYPAVLVICSYWKYEEPPQALLGCPYTFHLVEVELLSTGPEE